MSLPHAKGLAPSVPTYALYGELGTGPLPDHLHCESIPQRSALYDWEIRPHRHELFLQLLHVRSGGGRGLLDGSNIDLSAPCIVFVPPERPHGFDFEPGVDGSVVTVGAAHARALAGGQPLLPQALAEPRVLRPAQDAAAFGALEQALAALLDEFHGHAPWRAAALDARLSLLLLTLGRMAAPSAQGGAGSEASRGQRHLQRFTALVNQQFRERGSVAGYAAQLGITPTQLNRLCRASLGLSALGVLNRRTVREAERDLAYSSLSIKEIALSLGFADTAYFTRFFTRESGRAPSEFREEVRRYLAQQPAGLVPETPQQPAAA
ncbi:helix-turn-helix domain-containing protein [Caldimonas tepidiphila]|uniref:helix-turn-helix domain-containing protein n=1 Tax=Caldimonas tepidiphila TaxID=2315841 RepID=UPI0014749900|nr:helix-turn-helix domain-containing protein [Caldimonas tepidiphila]